VEALDVSVVVPVFNSEATLRPLLARLLSALKGTGRAFEVVFVDDGSRDGSWEVLRGLRREHPAAVTAVQLMRNYGQHNALMAGFRHARGALVVTMDDDLQHPPEEVPRLLEAIEAGDLDLVYGTFAAKRHSAWRNLGSTLLGKFYQRVLHTSVTPTSFRVMRRELVRSTFSYRLNFTIVDGLLAWNTQRIGSVQVGHQLRAAGRSGYTVRRLVQMAFNVLTNFSLVPLQVTSILGLLAATSGLAIGVYYLLQSLLQNIGVPGYASIITAVLVLGGVQLLALGVIGEYVGRIHLNINSKPQYIERQVLAATSPSYGARDADRGTMEEEVNGR
jgi:undecaprenyl-phosphate 4-deoxy-4-formamido-L-arabinose transferase